MRDDTLGSSPRHGPSTGPLESGLGFYAIVFTDIVRSTDLRAQLGDAKADRLHAEVDDLTREVVNRFRGTVVKGLGDGLLAVFRGPTEAVHAGVAIQHRLLRRNRGAVVSLHVRVGVAVGEVDVTPDDVFGYAVNEAARLCGAAATDGVLVGEMAATLARRADVEFGPAVSVPITPSAPAAVALPVLMIEEDLSLAPLANSLEFSQHGGRFVGRASELDVLMDQWNSVADGSVALALVTGEPGLGKTTLLGQFAREVTRGAGIVLYGRCDERPSAPYQPFAEAFGHFVEHCPVGELDRLLRPTANELSRVVPALADRLGSEAPKSFADPESERWRLHDAVGSALDALCRYEPVVLIIDDLHWAGTTTVDLLDRILRDAAHQRLMVVLALRPWDPVANPYVARLLADRHRLAQSVVDVALLGLAPDEVGALVAEWKHRSDIDAALTDELWGITAGNPLFVTQVLRTTDDDEVMPLHLPQGVADVIDRQLERMSAPTQGFLRVAALVGTRFEAQIAQVASELDRGAALDCLDEATLAAIVQPLEGMPLRYEFTNTLVRRAIENQFSAGRRRDAHARIAAALEDVALSDADDRVRRLAYHWSEAGEFGDPIKGVIAGCLATELAIGHLAIADATALLDRIDALAALVPDARRDCEIAVLRAEAQCLGAHPDARTTQLSATAAARQLGDARLMSRAALAHSRGYFSSYGRQDFERIGALESALAISDGADRATRALLLARLANELTFGDPERRRFALVDEALRLARELNEPAILAVVLNHRLYVLSGPDFLGDRLRDGHEMADIATATGDRLLAMHSCRLLCASATENADVVEVDRCLERLVQLNEQVDLAGAKWELASVRASRALIAGQLKEASTLVKEAFTLGSAAGQPDAFIFAGAQLMHLNYLRARLPLIIDTFLESAPAEVTTPLVAWVTRQLHLAGRVDQALEWWARTLATGLDAQVQVGVNAGLVLTSWAYMASVTGGPDEVVSDLRRRMAPYGDRLFNQLAPDQPGHHYLALLADVAGEPVRADEHFSASLALLERIGAPVMAASTRIAWAASLERRGERDRARALALAARSVATRAGATQLENEATELLERAL